MLRNQHGNGHSRFPKRGCSVARDMGHDFLDGRLSQSDRDAFVGHTERCDSCSVELAQMRRAELALRSASLEASPPGDLRTGFYARLHESSRSNSSVRRSRALPALAFAGAAAVFMGLFLPRELAPARRKAALKPVAVVHPLPAAGGPSAVFAPPAAARLFSDTSPEPARAHRKPQAGRQPLRTPYITGIEALLADNSHAFSRAISGMPMNSPTGNMQPKRFALIAAPAGHGMDALSVSSDEPSDPGAMVLAAPVAPDAGVRIAGHDDVRHFTTAAEIAGLTENHDGRQVLSINDDPAGVPVPEMLEN